MEPKPPSSGKTAAISGMAATQCVTLLLYIVHCFGVNDMTPEVAGAIIAIASTIAGGIMHELQRAREKKEAKNAEPNGVMGGPEPAQPVA